MKTLLFSKHNLDYKEDASLDEKFCRREAKRILDKNPTVTLCEFVVTGKRADATLIGKNGRPFDRIAVILLKPGKLEIRKELLAK